MHFKLISTIVYIMLLVSWISNVCYAKPPVAVIEGSKTATQALMSKNVSHLMEIFPRSELNWAGDLWMPISDSRNLLQNYAATHSFSFSRTEIYDFNACVEGDQARKYALKVCRVFDDRSYISVSHIVSAT